MHNRSAITDDHTGTADHHAIANHVGSVVNDHSIRYDHGVRPNVADVGPHGIHASEPRGNGVNDGRADGRGANNGLFSKERFAATEPIEVQPAEARPVALEDQERLIPVKAIDFGDRLATRVGDPKGVHLQVANGGAIVDLQMKVLGLAIDGGGGCIASRLGDAQFGNLAHMPGRGVLRVDPLGRCAGNGHQDCGRNRKY
jgi:hypothetical protein